MALSRLLRASMILDDFKSICLDEPIVEGETYEYKSKAWMYCVP